MTDLAKLANKISYMWKNPINFNTLIGKTIVSIEKDNNVILFTALDNEQYIMFHNQDCCECVEIEEIIGDLNDLIGTPILSASEDSNRDNPKPCRYQEKDYDDKADITYDDSHTWTFYNIATIKGYVTLRWYGRSNGYYSESVSFYSFTEKELEDEH